MNIQYKQRLVGAVVLVALGVILIPMILDGSGRRIGDLVEIEIPPEPEIDVAPLQELAALEPVPMSASGETPIAVVEPLKPESTVENKPIEELPKPDLKLSPSAWVLQVGSFSSDENAKKMRDELRKLKFTTFIQTAQSDSGKAYKVRVGPEVDRKNAEKLKQSLEKDHGYKSLLLKYP